MSWCHDIWCHMVQCWCLGTGQALSRLFVVFYWFLSQGVVDWSQREGPREEILGSILREKETRHRGPVMQIIQYLSIIYLFILIESYSKIISLSETGCVQLRSLEGASPQSPVMCGAQSSESPRSFLPLAIISHNQRILTGSQDPVTACTLHITGQHGNSDNTSSHNFPRLQSPDWGFCQTWSGIRLPDIDIIYWRQNLIHGDSQPVQIDSSSSVRDWGMC